MSRRERAAIEADLEIPGRKGALTRAELEKLRFDGDPAVVSWQVEGVLQQRVTSEVLLDILDAQDETINVLRLQYEQQRQTNEILRQMVNILLAGGR